MLGLTPALAARHGLSALLATTQRPELAEDGRALVAAGLKIKRQTLTVVDALRQVGIIPVLLKGYGLAVRLHPEQPLGRPATDVDILVAADELRQVFRALEALSLTQTRDVALSDPFEEHHHVSFSGSGGLVEVHFRLFSGFGGGAYDERAIRTRLRKAIIDGRTVHLLAPEDEFLYLATHAANHALLRLSWLYDLDRYLVRESPLDWGLMAKRARAAGFHRAVSVALAVLTRLFGTVLPAAAQRHFAAESPMDGWLFSSERVNSAQLAADPLASFLMRLWLVDSPAFGVRHVLDGARRWLRRRGHAGI